MAPASVATRAPRATSSAAPPVSRPARLDARDADFAPRFDALLRGKREASADVDEAVAAILADVETRGDAALLHHTRRLDGLDLDAATLRVSDDDIDRAVAAVPPALADALAVARDRILAFHERQRPRDDESLDALGVASGVRWSAIEAVGLYVPGGTASYPSSVLMNALPAKVAGCGRLAMCVPARGAPRGEAPWPAERGVIAPLVLAAARLAGVDEVWRVGGAQAIAALAYGTATIAPVAKIVGPGNAYVAAAKRRVYGRVGIDMVAGPSEVLILADATADPRHVAADILAQAEHDEAAQCVLVTDDAALADAVEAEVSAQLATLPRAAIAGASWARHGAILLVADLLRDAPALADAIAAEHLEIETRDPEALAARVRNAGSIFLGARTPEAIGDYVGGPNHVLPTARSARFASGLGVLDFMKRTTWLRCDDRALRALGPVAATLARAEGLEGHARSIERRLEDAGRDTTTSDKATLDDAQKDGPA